MNKSNHSILCIDDEENLLNALKRLLRKEGYRILTAGSGAEGLKILEENEVHLIISDQRMPVMSGTEFLAKVKERFPEIIRIVLSGYTDVDTITESINQGHIYKFILKPWNDQNLKLEIKRGLEQYELRKANQSLHEKIVQQNNELMRINAHLESLVQARTKELEIQNQALELSRAILEDVPIPIIGISNELMIVFINHSAQTLNFETGKIEIGKEITVYFSEEIAKVVTTILSGHTCELIKAYRIMNQTFELIFTPLSGRFYGQGVVLTLKALESRP
jgi:response regulator RpfG family c-di-GMP phosphodiesterase